MPLGTVKKYNHLSRILFEKKVTALLTKKILLILSKTWFLEGIQKYREMKPICTITFKTNMKKMR